MLISFSFVMVVCLFSYANVNFISFIFMVYYVGFTHVLGSNYAWKGLGVD